MIENIFIFLVEWASICLVVEGITGWGRKKGDFKKTIIASLLVLLTIALILVLIDYYF